MNTAQNSGSSSATTPTTEAGHHGGFPGLHPLLSDIRRGVVIISDSIRVRERRVLKATGLDWQVDTRNTEGIVNENSSRCPICMVEFHDPTVVLRVCGHGMHKECSETYFAKNERNMEDDEIGLCPICRKPLCEDDVLTLNGIVPPTEKASSWRSVQLTDPWAVIPTSSVVEGPSECSLDELLLSLRRLFTHENVISNLLKEITEEINRVKLTEISIKGRYAKLREDLTRREDDLDRAHDDLIHRETKLKKGAVAAQARISAREQELLKKSQELVKQHHELLRFRSELKSQDTQLRKEMSDFEDKQDKELKYLFEARKALKRDTRLAHKRKMGLGRTRQKMLSSSSGGPSASPSTRTSVNDSEIEEVNVVSGDEDAAHNTPRARRLD